MIRIAGLDLSTERTGLALPDGRTISITSKHGAHDPAARLHEIGSKIRLRLAAGRPQLVVLEGYSLGGRQGATAAVIAELGGVVRLQLYELNVPYIAVPPKSLKAWGAGTGNATKAQMLERAQLLGSPAQNHDEADAWLLRAAGIAWYHRHPGLPPLITSLKGLPWPTLYDQEVA